MNADPHQIFSFAHITDPHLTSLKNVGWRQLLNKRMLGYLSWTRNRHAEHRSEILDALLSDLQDTQPQHIAVTGDLTQIGTKDEFQQARSWLEKLGVPNQVSVIPGNHDAYVKTTWDDSFGCWQEYMQSDGGGSTFPFYRVRAAVAFIGLSSACNSAPFFATGRIGPDQLQRLAEQLEVARQQGLFRVVMVHHPAVPDTERWRKRLVDAQQLYDVIADKGAELVLHGHTHRTQLNEIEAMGRSIPVIGIPSASAIGRKPGRRAQYYLYTVSSHSGVWRMQISIREYDLADACFRAIEERVIAVPVQEVN